MPESSNNPNLAPLPESLKKQLEDFKKHLWRIKITEAILAGLLGLVVSFAIVFALDRIWEIPSIVRLIILLAGISLFTVFAPLWINRWVFKHRKENQLARLISKHYPHLGDRLLGVVELQNQDESQTALSPELREAAMIAVAHDAEERDLDKALSTNWTRKLALGLSGIALLAGGAFALFPNAGMNALTRWFMPLSDTERYTFTKVDLSKIPQPLYVPIGEKIAITIPLRDDTEEQPEFATAKYGKSQWKQFFYNYDHYLLEFPGKRDKGIVDLKIGDANHKIDVRPVQRPKVSNFLQETIFPDYLQRKPDQREIGSSQTEALVGSQLVITAAIDRKLSSATINSATFAAEVEPIDLEQAEIQGIDPNQTIDPIELDVKHTVSANIITTDPIEIKKGTINLPLSWIDEYGISGLAPAELTITSVIDTPPATYTQGTQKQYVIKYDDILEFEMSAEDNFGIKAAGVEWQGEFLTPSAQSPASGELELIKGDPYMTTGNSAVIIDFEEQGIIPQKLTVRTWAEDYNPDTNRVYSESIEVFVLSESEHANYIKEKMNETLSKLEDAMRTEQNNLDENKRLLEDLKDPRKATEAKEKIAEQQNKELDNTDEIKKLTEELKETFKEAAKNDSIDSKTLKDLAEATSDMQEMAQKDMPEITGDLDAAKDKKNSEEKTQEDLTKAIEKQEKLIEKMQETAAKAEKAKEKLESSTFVNRLKQAASEEESIAQSIIENLDGHSGHSGLAGLYYNELDPALKRLVQNLYLQQGQATSDVRWIQEDLAFFHARTQKPEHKGILDKMKAAEITEVLSKIEKTIEKQSSNLAIAQTIETAKLLREWAQELEGVQDQSSGGSGGSGGGGNQEDQDFEFMLKVMKMIQEEQRIRSKTRALEQTKRDITGSPTSLPKMVTPNHIP